MRFYETMFILKPTLTQEETNAKIEFFKSVLLNNGASIEATIDMGIRNLAYEIKKCKRGYYFVIYFKADGSIVAELERNYRINEEVIRFIVINYRNKSEQKNWSALVDKANGKGDSNESKAKKGEVSESKVGEASSADLGNFGDSNESSGDSSDSTQY